MDKKRSNNLKLIYGIDLILFGIILACHLFIKQFNFNDYWFVFIILPALADIILNKPDTFNVSLFVLSTSLLGYFIFNNILVSLVILVILSGILLVLNWFIFKDNKENKDFI